MRRKAALSVIAGGMCALAGCSAEECFPLLPTAGSASMPTTFGATVYTSDDIARAISLLVGCGAGTARVGLGSNLAFTDAFLPAAKAQGVRVILISPYANQPVDVEAYAANCASIHQRYAQYNPIWEIWNEPNLPQYWGGDPDVHAYARLAIATAKALRAAGAADVWSGGTSGIDYPWIQHLVGAGAYEVMNGVAVHTYEEPCTEYGQYVRLSPILPAGIQIHTTETCIPSTQDQVGFLRQLWYIHRGLGLPTMVWCELRDGTAGASGAFAFPYGLVTENYHPKPSYYAAQTLTSIAGS